MAVNPLRPAPGQPREYHFPPFSHRTLDNGLTVWTVPLADRALVSVNLVVDAGASSETEEQGGLAALTAQSLVTGTARLDANDFAEETERLGVEINSGSSWDSAYAGFGALAGQLDSGMGSWRDVSFSRMLRIVAPKFWRISMNSAFAEP